MRKKNRKKRRKAKKVKTSFRMKMKNQTLL